MDFVAQESASPNSSPVTWPNGSPEKDEPYVFDTDKAVKIFRDQNTLLQFRYCKTLTPLLKVEPEIAQGHLEDCESFKATSVAVASVTDEELFAAVSSELEALHEASGRHVLKRDQTDIKSAVRKHRDGVYYDLYDLMAIQQNFDKEY
mmetsp:Transcript_29640/g.45186  ORF Transcript_29640/g.45186 Transcript_29640/m.45186 type:complete len:148 (+) Transcript_29640:26-469(+)